MDITLKDTKGIVFHTAKKYCEEDISVKVNAEEVNIIPSSETQVTEGIISKVTVLGDEDLLPENIKKGVNIFGIDGGFDAVDTRDATVTVADVVEGKTVYVNNQKVIGTIPDNGTLEFEPSDNEQVIPSGVTAGGIVKAADITTLNEYNECLTIANSILGGAS